MFARFAALLTKGRGQHGQRICKAPGHGFAKGIQPKTAEHFKTAAIKSNPPIPIPALFLALLVTLVTSTQAFAAAGTWSDFATVSMTDPQTQKLTANGICWSDGTDILCDGTAGLASGGGTTADKIISSTTKVTANTTGYISFTTAGTTTGYMDTAGVFTLPGISTTSNLTSVTTLYASGKVGIGTSAPSYPLDVSGSVNIPTNAYYRIAGTGVLTYNGGTTQLRAASQGHVEMITSASTVALHADATGYVGIGTTAPSTTLHIAKGSSGFAGALNGRTVAAFEGSSANGAMVSVIATSNTNAMSGIFLGNANLETGGQIQYFSSLNKMILATGQGAGVMTLDASSRLGIGAASSTFVNTNLGVSGTALTTSWTGINFGSLYATPTAPLEVSGTVSATRFVGDGSGLTGIVASSNGDNITSGTTKITANTTGYVSFTTGGTTTGYMDTAGKFILPGVSSTGTVSATSMYAGNIGATGSIIYRDANGILSAVSGLYYNTANASAYTSGGFVGGLNLGVTSGPYLVISNSVPLIRTANAGQDLSFGANGFGGPEAMRITSSALVGIGTTQPSATLHVAGTVSTTAAVTIGDGINTGTLLTVNGDVSLRRSPSAAGNFTLTLAKSGAATQYAAINMNNAFGLWNNSDGTFFGGTIGTSATSVMAFGGNKVGINVPAPTTSLEVSGTISATNFVGNGSGLTNIPAGTVSTGASGSLVYRDQSGNLIASSSLSISSTTGSVGLGAGAPGSLGSYSFYSSNNIQAANGLLSGYLSTGYINLATGDGIRWNGNADYIFGYSNTGQHYLTFNTSNTEAMRIVSTGYVGIGTSAPAYPLDVSMSSANLVRFGTSSQNINLGAFSVVNSSGNLAVRSANDLNLQSGGSTGTKMIIQAGGNVGIGTGSPNANLEVSGTVSATSMVANLGTNTTYYNANNVNSYAGNGYSLTTNAAAGSNAALTIGTGPAAPVIFNTSGTEAMRIVSTSRVGIGTSTPNATLQVSGTVQIGGTGSETCSTPADYGKNRYNPVTGHMQVCVNR